MSKYIIYFNQQWVGDHSAEWFGSRGPLARAVVSEMKEARVLIFAGGLEEDIGSAFGFDGNGDVAEPISATSEFLGGLTVIEVDTEAEAKLWGTKIAQACGWPQEIRKFKGN